MIVVYSLTDLRPRYQVQELHPLNYAQEANKLAQLIKQYDMNEESLFVN